MVLSGLAILNPVVATIGSVILLLIVLTRKRPVLIVYGLTLAMPLTGGLARGSVVPILRLSQALVVLGFILSLLAISSRQGKSRLTAIDLAFVIYMLAGAVFPMLALYYRGEHLNLFQTDPIFGTTPIQDLLGPIQDYLLYRIVVVIISSEKQITMVLKLAFVASIIVSAIGILQKLGVGPVKTFLATYYPAPTNYLQSPDLSLRITSTLQFFSGLAAYLTFTIILALVCYMARDYLKIPLWLLAITVMLDSIALVLTGTLAAWVGLPIGALVVFLLMRRLPRLVVFSLVGIILTIVIFQSFLQDRLNQQFGPGAAQGLLPQSFALRVTIWSELSLPAIGQHLLFGSGPVPFQSNYIPVEDSQYIHQLLEGGISYLLSYLLLIGTMIGVCWQHIKSRSEDVCRAVAIALIAILVSINVMNVAGNYFTYVGGIQTIWLLMAMVVASKQIKEPLSSVSASNINC